MDAPLMTALINSQASMNVRALESFFLMGGVYKKRGMNSGVFKAVQRQNNTFGQMW